MFNGNSEDEKAEDQEIGDEDSDDGSLNLVQSDSEDDGQVILSSIALSLNNHIFCWTQCFIYKIHQQSEMWIFNTILFWDTIVK